MTKPEIKLYQDLTKSFIEVGKEVKLLKPVVDKFGLTENILEYCKMLLGVPQSELMNFDELSTQEKLSISSLFNDNFIHMNSQGGPKTLLEERFYFFLSICKMMAQFDFYIENQLGSHLIAAYLDSTLAGWLMIEAGVWTEIGYGDKLNVEKFSKKVETMKSRIKG